MQKADMLFEPELADTCAPVGRVNPDPAVKVARLWIPPQEMLISLAFALVTGGMVHEVLDVGRPNGEAASVLAMRIFRNSSDTAAMKSEEALVGVTVSAPPAATLKRQIPWPGFAAELLRLIVFPAESLQP